MRLPRRPSGSRWPDTDFGVQQAGSHPGYTYPAETRSRLLPYQ